jgi:hypothetical protein
MLHTCSEFYKSKDKEGGGGGVEQAQEEGAGSKTEATPISGKPGEVPVVAVPTAGGGGGGGEGGDTSGKPADKPTDTPSSTTTSTTTSTVDKPTAPEKAGGKKSSSSRSGKDVEMKDSDQAAAGGEPGSIGEPGSHQAICVLGIALIAMGEDIGAEMALRTFNHLVRFTVYKNFEFYFVNMKNTFHIVHVCGICVDNYSNGSDLF